MPTTIKLTADEIRIVQAFRGLPKERKRHLTAYASGLVVEHASRGRVLAATAELERETARRWARDMGRAARQGGAR